SIGPRPRIVGCSGSVTTIRSVYRRSAGIAPGSGVVPGARAIGVAGCAPINRNSACAYRNIGPIIIARAPNYYTSRDVGAVVTRGVSHYDRTRRRFINSHISHMVLWRAFRDAVDLIGNLIGGHPRPRSTRRHEPDALKAEEVNVADPQNI